MSFSWKKLDKPFFALAPMEGATDTVFRQIIASCGRPDVFFTEFTNCEGILSPGFEKVAVRLKYSEFERPIIAQIWGTNPESFYRVAQKLSEMKFDGIDINMGCPERAVIKHGACSALINNPKLAKEIIDATRSGAGSLPLSVKTRIGFKTIEIDPWIGFLLEQKLDALTVHFRTQKEMSLVPAHWEEAARVVALRNKLSQNTILIGNGDVLTKTHGRKLSKLYGLDGIMIGRGVFHNPYVFNEDIDYENLTKKEKLELLIRHLDLFEKTWGDNNKSYPPLKRFFKIYIQGFEGAGDLREKIMKTNSIKEAREVLQGL